MDPRKINIQGGNCLKRGAWIVCRFKRGLTKKACFLGGIRLIPNAHYGWVPPSSHVNDFFFVVFLAKCFFTVCFRFSCMYFFTIRMALIEKLSYTFDFLEAFHYKSCLLDFRLKKTKQLSG